MSALSLTYHDVNEAYTEVMTLSKSFVREEPTRNGKAWVFPSPVLIQHTAPQHRVLFDADRNANPFFHYMEAIWMLSGSDNVKFPSMFAQNLRNYSDNGRTFHGAYGHRWRAATGFDQIAECVRMLTEDPTTRRAVITMWDAVSDLGSDSKDLPCNTQLYLQIRDGLLNMTVCNRSNDLVWGMLGANIVHFSILLEYLAGAIKVGMGSLYQFSNNVHIYEGWQDKFSDSPNRWYRLNKGYSSWKFSPDNLSVEEAVRFVWDGVHSEEAYRSRILQRNAVPMMKSWIAHKIGDKEQALIYARGIYDDDWRYACVNWLVRKHG